MKRLNLPMLDQRVRLINVLMKSLYKLSPDLFCRYIQKKIMRFYYADSHDCKRNAWNNYIAEIIVLISA